jgi:hypothetical protein
VPDPDALVVALNEELAALGLARRRRATGVRRTRQR